MNGQHVPLDTGQVWSLIPEDAHSIHARVGKRLTYINVAFPVATSTVPFRSMIGPAAPKRTPENRVT